MVRVAFSQSSTAGLLTRKHRLSPGQTFAAMPSFDKQYVAFGKLVDGTKLLRFLEALDCKNDRPNGELVISDAGRVAKKSLVC